METSNRSVGIGLLRVMVGVVFLTHGLQKLLVFGLLGTAGFFANVGIPYPAVAAVLATAAETLGGLALIFGLFTRPAAAILAVNMTVAIFAVHLKKGFFLPTGYEYALTMLVANVTLVLTGAGAFALDNSLQSRLSHWRHAPTAAPLRG